MEGRLWVLNLCLLYTHYLQVWLGTGEILVLAVGPVPHQGGVPLPPVPGQVQAIDAQGVAIRGIFMLFQLSFIVHKL